MPYIGQAPTQAAFVTDTFSGNGSTTAFTMSVAPANTASVLVAVSGVLQDPSTYSVSGLTLTFSAAPPTGTGNISARYLGIPASGVTTTAYRTVTEFTATAGQTTFTPPSYTAGFINVYRNGARLGSADYTATNGTTVVLATGATSGDLVTVESFLVSSVLNAIPNTANSISWSNLPAGSVLQVVNATTGTQTSVSSTTFVDTTLTATITPKFATSKILVFVSQNGAGHNQTNTYLFFQLLRNSTVICLFEKQFAYNSTAANHFYATTGTNYLDSPATTSAVTYKTQFNTQSGGLGYCQAYGGELSTMTLMEIAG